MPLHLKISHAANPSFHCDCRKPERGELFVGAAMCRVLRPLSDEKPPSIQGSSSFTWRPN
jgi:hypothetical protein